MAVAGLNPHAGEGGLLGREELEVLGPAVEESRRRGIRVVGPESPDTVFVRAQRGEFDWVLALYHDQGLIAVKSMAFGMATNWTLGLPYLRTSVDHGTAYSLAGTGKADATPLSQVVETSGSKSRSMYVLSISAGTGLILTRPLLLLFVLVAPVVHDPANWRSRVRGHLHKVEANLLRQHDRLFWRHDTKLFTVCTDHAHLADANPLIYTCRVPFGSYDSKSGSGSDTSSLLCGLICLDLA